jgi:hypothetical protein
MSIDAIKQELSGLDAFHRNQIVAFLLSIDDQRDANYRTSLTRKIDDRDSSNWATLEDLDKKLSITDHETAE